MTPPVGIGKEILRYATVTEPYMHVAPGAMRKMMADAMSELSHASCVVENRCPYVDHPRILPCISLHLGAVSQPLARIQKEGSHAAFAGNGV